MGLVKSITLNNLTGGSLSYMSGIVTIAASSSLVINTGILAFLFNDDGFIDDIGRTNLSVTTSRGDLLGSDCLDYISKNVDSLNRSFNSNDPITFASSGYGFSITAEFSLPNTSETPILMLRNPANSGFAGRAIYFYAATNSTQGILTTRAYGSPTVTSVGTDISSLIQNNYAGFTNPPTPVIKAYSGPTISANGVKRMTFVSSSNTSPPMHEFKQTAILGQGQDFLVTCQAANLGLLSSLSCTLFLLWVEV